ncbi:TetR/AcrR family transcriptional regulator [Streptomyces sp. NPDC049936]|uniref:TetR/AcrR family transcriptional regulator n=1 Tax=Streptomyces sp. NPDC049936 TaxID=3365599 RepID=UPI0037AC6FD3
MARPGRPREFDIDRALEAALHVFWEHGYEATSLAQLRAALGISSASFYAAFASKEELFIRIVERYAGSYARVTSPLADEDLSSREAIERALRASVAMQTDSSHPLGCLFVVTGTLNAPEDARVHKVLAEHRAVDRQNILACIERAMTRGELPADTNAPALEATFHMFLAGISTEARDGATAETLDAAVDQLMTIWDTLARQG